MGRYFNRDERRAARIVDAQRDERLQRFAAEIEKLIQRDREEFRLEFAAAAIGIDPADRTEAAERAYELAARRTFRDQELTEREKRALDWLAARLGLDEEHRKAADFRVGCETFEAYLDRALSDGLIEKHESRTLEHLAAWLGLTIDELIQKYFTRRGESFLKAMFAAILRDGEISDEEWQYLSAAAHGLGTSDERLLSLIGGQAERYVESLIAEARQAGVPSAQVRSALDSLLKRLPLSPRFRGDVDQWLRPGEA